MLMHIPEIFTPQLLKLMMEMGHGEELLICDANFPYKTVEKETVFLPGCHVAPLLEEVLRFFPLDQSVEYAAASMDSARENGVYERYSALLAAAEKPTKMETLPRFDFYERAGNVAGIAVTSDTVKGGNIIIKKGVVRNEET